MNGSLSTEHAIRQYLLGKLNDQDGLEDSLSLQILTDDELSEIADVIEDEIIEDYLDGTLSATDKKAVEEYFLSPVERKEKLRFAKLLRDHLASKAEAFEAKWSRKSLAKRSFSLRSTGLRKYSSTAFLSVALSVPSR